MGMIMGFLIMFYGVLRNHTFAAGTGIILMGMDVVILPFTTPETVSFLGYQKSKIAGRILGIMLVIVGIWFEFL
jgi:small neutral amino acid transporter SnatA (MarC family)